LEKSNNMAPQCSTVFVRPLIGPTTALIDTKQMRRATLIDTVWSPG
jgi:hypothetical protein